ncbi:cytochrome c biogenesis protein DipZ [Solimicrobium silvestre]|uniref:Cytochrome C biogenesis protein transmembrane region n=1 Tax=Solimicrobium silvestre TaxID=2099400 RepID=A0A2S9GWE5_9BURK|nr:cytochrome c biogenesis protein DipZ [Solimicrobium silvestre]PRC92042.1 Cytochrome C biogenesis protein transmembrane region [Solimicrobium silvestre]
MILVLLVFLGGVLTILSPCILPVLPFVFSRAEQPFLKSGLPMLVGMAISFTAIATLAAVGGAWAVHINQYGRIFSLILLTLFALTLLSKRLADWVSQPFVAAGNRLLQPSTPSASSGGLVRSLVLGVATGLLWAPCAGPILGLVLTGAAISGPNTQTTLLLFAYAAGAATSLALAILVGGRVFFALKKSLGAGEWIRRGLGIAVLGAVTAILFGWDNSILTSLSTASTNSLEQSLVNSIHQNTPAPEADTSMAMGGAMTGAMAANNSMMMSNQAKSPKLPIEGNLPQLNGATSWLNSAPLTPEALHGKVVLVDFWTYSCINCLRSLPYVKSWYDKYKDHGLVVIGVHAPEFAFEKDADNVQHAVRDLGVQYPVALDNNYAIWQGFDNQYWPAHYFVDAQGQIRGHHFGEGNYTESEQTIRQLLTEAGYTDLPPLTASTPATDSQATGVQAASDEQHIQSPETYIGYSRAKNFISPDGIKQDSPQSYTLPSELKLNQWGLSGNWTVGQEQAVLNQASGKIAFRFLARDLHLVVGPGKNGKQVRFRVLLDRAAPAMNHGTDIDADGNGTIHEQRLYQLIRQSKLVGEHTFSIEFLDKDAQAFSFTFG